MLLALLDVQDALPLVFYFLMIIGIAAIGGTIFVGIPLWLISKLIGRSKVDREKLVKTADKEATMKK